MPTGPMPSSSTASHCVVPCGHNVVSNSMCASAASTAVATQKPATVAVGTAAKRRDSTE